MPFTQRSAAVDAFLMSEPGSFIDGKAVRGTAGETIVVIDPATEEELASIEAAGAKEVDAAVAAARRSFDDRRWRGLAPQARRDILWKLGDLIAARANELAELDVLDNGMPLAFAKWEMSACTEWLRHFAGQAAQIHGINASAALSGGGTDIHAYTSVQPVGVAALIVPWNAPTGNMMIKLAPALATGCSVIIKPAEETPLTSTIIAQLCLEAGVPEGVVNVVVGTGREAGARLAAHPGVDKVSFTGSTATGKAIVAAAAGNLKRVTLELGGKSPVIVCDDADLDLAIPAVANAIFANSGQICFAGSRLFVHSRVYDKVIEGVAEFAKGLKIGNGFDPSTNLGPLISGKQRDQVTRYLESGRTSGGQIVTGGTAPTGPGFFVEPTVFANVAQDREIAREEIFGPVLVATPFDDLDVVVGLANDTRYGLGSGVFTRDVNKVHWLAGRIDAGNVWVNTYGITHPAMPFGGMKESGWGREMSSDVLDAYTEKKSVFVALSSPVGQ
ncbi:aldehyde dehydrogenase family protein [Sphingobium sp. DEHP117]|uniref:aldehyde dehydrogenase family protein n=1 Tax=Sphingobium sp. DEHP117 TaxID=2993436 RepID=UPI0027D54FE9|nr:aldehyde dehydrogenase family protein [Sphingobium sp. DEHP117]MDQ4421579.1 aldehyde dehydrogenase family protein [Sphingobium sp. DEHP117]